MAFHLLPRVSARLLGAYLFVTGFAAALATAANSAPFSLKQARSYPFPADLVAAPTGERLAWTVNQEGRRNVWVAEGPDFTARPLTAYADDDGQELTSVQFSRDGQQVIFVRGGDHNANRQKSSPVNPSSSPVATHVQVCAVAFAGGAVRIVDEGDGPAVGNGRIAYLKNGEVWIAALGDATPARRLLSASGTASELRWSPDGRRLAFTSQRGDHAFIGLYESDATGIIWLAPSTGRDSSPRWSPDGTELVFVRRPGVARIPRPLLEDEVTPWSLWIADARSGQGRRLWQSARTPRASFPGIDGGANLQWAARGRVVFASFSDGWPHFYSIAASGGEAMLLTPGNYLAEHISLSADGMLLAFTANTGADADDDDRRHVVVVPVDRAAPRNLTQGTGTEWRPVFTGNGATLAYISATLRHPPLVAVMQARGGEERLLARDTVPADFPSDFIAPQKVVFRAADGTAVHGQLFLPAAGTTRGPAVLFLHGGPRRQMLLGWHYWDYYSNFYALNQYLASRGVAVLSVNYRMGIGYGHDFQYPKNGGQRGVSQYQDILAAADYLAARPEIDPKRIGLYGASDGGFLTALGLSRDSARFAAGVDISGVSDWTRLLNTRSGREDVFDQAPDFSRAMEVMWRSSPASSVDQWKSPVLVIHADDDRTNEFSQTVDLVARLGAAGVPFEEIVIPDDTHHFLRHANWIKVDEATAEFFERKLKP